jgi:hypothetical protein
MKLAAVLGFAVVVALSATASAQIEPSLSGSVIKLGVLTDMALAVQELAHNNNKVLLISGAAASDLTGRACAPISVHWTYDTVALANGTGGAVVGSGGDTWFFVTADYAFGYDLERDTATGIRTTLRAPGRNGFSTG